MAKKHTFKPVTPNNNFPEMEKRLLSEWYEKGIVAKYLHRNDGSDKRFSFLDGPITANNPMGVHHAWGRTYKDLWQRFWTLRGRKERFQNGFDCQGLWVEVEVEKELQIRNKKDIENLVSGDPKASVAKFVELCKERVRKFSSIQSEQSKRLGYIVDWDHSYFTMSDENNYMIWHFLKTCFEKGWIYKGRESVPWCPRCETAISQHEMLTEDYKEVSHKSVYLAFPIVERKNEYLLVWTTTPWTIPANIAIAVDKTLDYSLVEGMTGNKFWMVKERVEAVFGKEYKQIVKTVKGKELVGLFYTGPFDDLEVVAKVAKDNPKTFHTVVATDPLLLPVTTTEGTGLVHTAVSAGSEDFQLGKKYGLPMIPVIADNADYLPSLGFLAGKNAKKHPEIIIDYLTERNAKGNLCLFKVENYMHRYPACWRCKTELVWKVADEWYIAMDTKEKSSGKTLREQMMDTARQITWKPAFGLDRELDWLSNMHDWLISKPNRYWGLALPIYECKKCGNFTVIGSKEELKEKAVAGWNQFDGHSPHKPFIDEVKIRCEKCGETVSRLNDVGNVWLDAGIVGFSTLIDPMTNKLSYTSDKAYWRQWYPADFITESFPGQFKNWFYSMIAMSTVLEQKTCFKTVLGYASMLGEDGRPMHKSWGNAIEFNEGADKIGADVMRWMFVKHNPEQNILFGYKLADETRRKFHLLLWNVYNFFVTYATVDSWSPGAVTSKSSNVLDIWILSELHALIKLTTKSLEVYDAATAANAIETFVTNLSQWYVRRSRDRVGPTVDNSVDKNACFATMFEVLVTLTKLLAPFTPFIADEMYMNLTGEESVHLADWPEDGKVDAELEKAMTDGRTVASLLLAFRKQANVKVRIPFKKLNYRGPRGLTEAVKKIVLSEANVYELIYEGKNEVSTDYYSVGGQSDVGNQDVQIGMVRDVVRQIQMLRKEKGCKIDERVIIELPSEYKDFTKELLAYIQKETLATKLTWGNSLQLSTG
ncbi:MAG TPA: isoleucine--tRNA ligase [Patescibacteria group bacterium]|nr:isoleucine--tRNA ligase [Patescibacteria group bacterium]